MRQPIKLLRMTLLIGAWALLTLVVLPVQGQPANLLTNPGFESPYRDVGGSPPRSVATGWTPWHTPRTDDMPSFQNTQPEYEAAAPDTTRIREGANAQRIFTSFFTFEGGVFQRLTGVSPGTELRFSVYAYVWSSSLGNPNVSEFPAGVLVQAGIDPTGGTDPASSSIVWSSPAAFGQYDAYRQYAVRAEAVSSAVTVFVRIQMQDVVADTSVWLDDAVLEPTSQVATPEPTNTPQPPTNTPQPPTNTPQVATDTQQPPTDTPASPVDPTPTPEQLLPTDTPPPVTVIVVTPQPALPTATATADSELTQLPGRVAYVVRRGDSVSAIATLYDSTISAIISANNLNSNGFIREGDLLFVPVALPAQGTAIPNLTAPAPTQVPVGPGGGGGIPGTEVAYLVIPGDTLSSIAARFGTTVALIAQRNGILNPNRILAGQTLIVPAATTVVPPPPARPATYVVRPGDNLYRISLRFGVSMLQIAQANGIFNVNRIFAGQVLVIP
ncbi:LysM peptidoglycan-binding domain-containing protein [bacterium]|nr:LysM peptidoglycan-binding domain-containing protein [bacterium]